MEYSGWTVVPGNLQPRNRPRGCRELPARLHLYIQMRILPLTNLIEKVRKKELVLAAEITGKRSGENDDETKKQQEQGNPDPVQ